MVAIRRRNRSFQLWLNDIEADQLEELAKNRQLSKAELIRTLITENLESSD